MIKEKLVENAKNPFKIDIKIQENAFVCPKCSFIIVQDLPKKTVDKNCPQPSCNLGPLEEAGPYVFVTSEEALKTLRDLNNCGSLENEALHIDFQPSRIAKHTTLASYTYDLDLRTMAPLFSAILTKETEMSVYVILELVRKEMEDKIACKFDPAMYMADEAACFKNAVIRQHGISKLSCFGTCELHFMKSVFEHCSSELGSQQKQFEHLKFCEGLLNASSPAIYENLYKSYRAWTNERPSRISCLSEFQDWWHARRCGWSKAFRQTQLPRTNLAEVGNAKFSSRSGMTNLSLDMGLKALISEHQNYVAKKRGVVNGDFVVGKGRSRLNLEEKEIKELFKRIKETPIDEEEESEIINNILNDILGEGNFDPINPQHPNKDHVFLDDVKERQRAFQDSPSNKEATHRPPARDKITPRKNELPKSGRVRINLQTPKDSLQQTMNKSIPRQLYTDGMVGKQKNLVKSKSAKSPGEDNLKRAWNSFNQLIEINQSETGKFKLHIQKSSETVTYDLQIIGRLSCTCKDFTKKNKNNPVDKLMCKHFLYTLLAIGVDPMSQREILTKYSSSHYSEDDMSVIYTKCMDFDASNFDNNDIFQKLDRAMINKSKKLSDLDKRLKEQNPLPYINDNRFYGSYRTKNEAMEEILTNKERFTVTWYALLATDGRRQCPGNGDHDRKCIKRGQLCLAADFNSVMVRKHGEDTVYKIKDQRRFFCLQKECSSEFVKRELRDFSNIKAPKVVNVNFLHEGSREQFLKVFPHVEMLQYNKM